MAAPLSSRAKGEPALLASTMNWTVPVGMPVFAGPVTFTVNVTVSATKDGLTELETAISGPAFAIANSRGTLAAAR